MKTLRTPIIATCGTLWGASVALLMLHGWRSAAGVTLGLIAFAIAIPYAAVTVAQNRKGDSKTL